MTFTYLGVAALQLRGQPLPVRPQPRNGALLLRHHLGELPDQRLVLAGAAAGGRQGGAQLLDLARGLRARRVGGEVMVKEVEDLT